EVFVSGPGVGLSIEGRPIASLAGARGPVAHTFDEIVEGPFAIWSFEREREEEHAFVRSSAELSGGAVRIVYTASGGRRLAVVVRPDGPERTRLEVSLEAGEADSLELSFPCEEGGTFHGFGEQYDGTEHR